MAKHKKAVFAGSALVLGLTPLAFGANSFAAVSYTDINTESDLIECLEQKREGTCTLGGDISLSKTVMVYDKIILDMNNHNITAINPENGTFEDANRLMITVNHGADFTVKGNGIISTGETEVMGAIRLTDKNTLDESKTAKFTLNDATLEGKYYGISGNGTRHNTEVIVNSGTIKSGETGIYNPQNGSVVLNGGKIEAGLAGVEIRSGSLVVKEGVEINVDENAEYKIDPNGNGTTTSGAAIAIAQHNTKLPINVEITGGSFTAPVPIIEANPQKNDQASIDKVSMSIAGGKFVATNTEGYGAVYSEDKTGFITGGSFNIVPEALIAENCDYAKTQDGDFVVLNPTDLEKLDKDGY